MPTDAPVDIESRAASSTDDTEIARLLAAAYVGTIDFDADADYAGELNTWRRHDGADDAASRVITRDGRMIGACLIGSELGQPFLYEIAVLDSFRGRRLASTMLSGALAHLAGRGHEACSAWVTFGNVASERLLTSAGFVPVTPPVDERRGVRYHRAASVLGLVDTDPGVAAGVTVDESSAVLWLLGGRSNTPEKLDVRDTTVMVRWIEPDQPDADEIVATMMPVRHVAGLLARRRRHDLA